MTMIVRSYGTKMGSQYFYFAAANTLEKIEKIPTAFWLKVGLAVLIVVLAVVILRKLLNVNKFVLGGVLFIAAGLIFFNWIYHRTEPKFLTPLVDRIAPFFPSAGAYEAKQATTPGSSKK
jgi:amino acid transporter